MTKFRPCIDLHDGQVKQIVGGTLRDHGSGPKENFVSDRSPEWFSELYREHDLRGGHVIKLGAGNDEAAKAALAAWPNGMQLGGGISAFNAEEWITAGASHVIVTSWLFNDEGKLQKKRVKDLVSAVGRERLVIDLSCRRSKDGWIVAMNRWQTLTDLPITEIALDSLAEHCSEFLIHAADVEGLCQGIDAELVEVLGEWGRLPMTYAGGVATMDDMKLVEEKSEGKVDVTVGSALDLFGGKGVKMEELLVWNAR